MSSEWGPRLWRVLHVIAERHTTPAYNMLIVAFLENMHNILPCAVCQKHCRTYWIAHQIRGPVVSAPPSGRFYRGGRGATSVSSMVSWDPHLLREWVWAFHNAVTERTVTERTVITDASGGDCATFVPFPKESLSATYSSISVGEDIEFLYTYLTRQTMQMRIKPAALQLFRSQMERLRLVYGLDVPMRIAASV